MQTNKLHKRKTNYGNSVFSCETYMFTLNNSLSLSLKITNITKRKEKKKEKKLTKICSRADDAFSFRLLSTATVYVDGLFL